MDVVSALFYVFSAVLLFAAFRVITARNPVHAALYLVLAFFQASGIWMLLKAEFLSIALVLVYIGAVMVLFLFVVMMLDIDLDSIRQGFWKHFPLAAMVGAVIALELAAVLLSGFRISEPVSTQQAYVAPVLVTETVTLGKVDGVPVAKLTENVAVDAGHMVLAETSNTRELGIALYTDYLYPVQIAAILLLVALIAAIALTLRKRKDSKSQNPGEQVRVRARDRVTLVKMDPVKPAAPAAEESQA